MAMVRTFGDKAGGQTEVKIKRVFTAVCVKFSSGGENQTTFKNQRVSAWPG
jgi:hypothetical protein